MSCFYPRPVAKVVAEDGKRSVDFNPKGWVGRDVVHIPCGKCDGCRADQAMTWAIRCHHESLYHSQASFVTLTYDNDHCPSGLVPNDLTKFFKRCRHHFPLRYFACGELGELTRRPHYHALIFGQDFLGGAVQRSQNLYSSPVLDELWPYGFNAVGSVEFASILYVAGYATKKVGDPDTFVRMSRNPPIGRTHFERYKSEFAKHGFVVIDGQKYPIPKRYFDWDDLQCVKDKRSEMFRGKDISSQALSARQAAYTSRKRLKSEKL